MEHKAAGSAGQFLVCNTSRASRLKTSKETRKSRLVWLEDWLSINISKFTQRAVATIHNRGSCGRGVVGLGQAITLY